MGLQCLGFFSFGDPSQQTYSFHRRLPGLVCTPSVQWRRLGIVVEAALRLTAVVALISFWFISPVLADENRSKQPEVRPRNVLAAEAEREIIRYTNIARGQKGVAPLIPSAALHFLARTQSANICKALKTLDPGRSRNKCSLPNFEHESDLFPKGWRLFSSRLKMVGLRSGAENIACRTVNSDVDQWARTIVKGWLTSRDVAHRRNILNANHTFIGVGVVGCIDRIGYVTQVFSDRPGSLSKVRE
jgi:uncharacterized protein YkwD